MNPPTHTQKLLFNARMWDPASIRAWIASQPKSKGFTSKKIHLLDKDYHVRQRDPGDFVPGSFKTIPFGDVKKTGIQGVIGHLKSEAKPALFRFDGDRRTDGTIRQIRAANRGLDREVIDRIAALGVGRSFKLDLGAGGVTRIERVR